MDLGRNFAVDFTGNLTNCGDKKQSSLLQSCDSLGCLEHLCNKNAKVWGIRLRKAGLPQRGLCLFTVCHKTTKFFDSHSDIIRAVGSR